MQTSVTSPAPGFERILAAARRRFEQFGFRRTGVAEIARDAGVAPGTIYGHFRNKEDLFRSVVEADHASWLARAREILRGPGTAAERLSRLGLASIEFQRESRLLRAVLQRDRDMVSAPLLEPIHEWLLSENVALMAEVIAEGAADGTLRPLDPEKSAYVLFALGQTLFDQRHHAYEDLAPIMGEITLRGLLAS